ncbi:uncharacterized protein LOC132705088 [Cylas formicarius]|uniref:uncharacterized protein LOC132705088 n=1 Tax=Cylas formicarius TaxID=197179 RepID=UPI002958B906|nr:uncharacterized protein LOC132705088 [Cylas formicarius]
MDSSNLVTLIFCLLVSDGLCDDSDYGFKYPKNYVVQHTDSKLYLSKRARLIQPEDKAVRVEFYRNHRDKVIQIVAEDSREALEIENDCSGTDVVFKKLNPEAKNQKFIINEDGTIGTQCDSKKVLSRDQNSRKVIVVEKDSTDTKQTKFSLIEQDYGELYMDKVNTYILQHDQSGLFVDENAKLVYSDDDGAKLISLKTG